VATTLAVFDSIYMVSNFKNVMGQHKDFVVKPANGSQGRGITVVTDYISNQYQTAGGKYLSIFDIEQEIAAVIFGKYGHGIGDVALVEERLIPHKLVLPLSPKGLFDIRVIIVNSTPILSMLRLPTIHSSGKANLHQGGIGVGIDLRSGVTTNAFYKAQFIDTHPDTKANLIDFKIPFWNEIQLISKKIGDTIPLKYLGIDFTITDRHGPLVLEINARPGLEIQNANRRGIISILNNNINFTKRKFT
ncbi:MAG: sugar-transfer associated ATP-grasp domain-containing protein, partial [Bdellovibrionales bacterium]